MRLRHRKRTILLALTSTHHGFYHGAARYAAKHDWHVVADMIYDAMIPIGWKGDEILSFVGHWEEVAQFVISQVCPPSKSPRCGGTWDSPTLAKTTRPLGSASSSFRGI
jgi:hypothetical protein